MEHGLDPELAQLRQRYTALFDDDLVPLVRRMAEPDVDEDGYAHAEIRATVWRALTELGTLGLALPDAYDGRGESALATVLEVLGTALYQGPLQDTLLAVAALTRSADGPVQRDLLAAVCAGAPVAATVRDGTTHPERAPIIVHGDSVTAERPFVPFAADAEFLLIVGTTPAGERRAAVVRRAGRTVALHRRSELGRGELYAVSLSGTPVETWLEFGSIADSWPALLASARLRQAAYLVGLASGALRLGVERARHRHQFGGPIGRQQAVAFTLARAATYVDAARLLTQAAAEEADIGVDHRLCAIQTLATAAATAGEVARDVVQVHGAHGMTEDCPAQLYYRRAAVETVVLGAPSRLRAEAVPLLLGGAGVPPPDPDVSSANGWEIGGVTTAPRSVSNSPASR